MPTTPSSLAFRPGLLTAYPDLLTPGAIDALETLAPFDRERRELMARRLARRAERARERRPLAFLDAGGTIARTSISVADAITPDQLPKFGPYKSARAYARAVKEAEGTLPDQVELVADAAE